MAAKKISITVKVWRQASETAKGCLETYALKEISTDMSFLEMLDLVNEKLTHEGKEPIAFDNDCREGICGTCGCVVDGVPHGPQKAMTLCQLHMRHFSDGDTIYIEPFRAKAFPVLRDGTLLGCIRIEDVGRVAGLDLRRESLQPREELEGGGLG